MNNIFSVSLHVRSVKYNKKEPKHEALEDVRDSIEEMCYYRDHFLKCSREHNAT